MSLHVPKCKKTRCVTDRQTDRVTIRVACTRLENIFCFDQAPNYDRNCDCLLEYRCCSENCTKPKRSCDEGKHVSVNYSLFTQLHHWCELAPLLLKRNLNDSIFCLYFIQEIEKMTSKLTIMLLTPWAIFFLGYFPVDEVDCCDCPVVRCEPCPTIALPACSRTECEAITYEVS